jgi:alkanesulfonate monooxygenase SsuD/methylene tetrahydromethanopterin reductase-like flavin-dependent oxidoreductase (luciferase family)
VLIGIQGSGQLPGRDGDPGRYKAVAELAEERGYDSIWAGEHLSFHNPILDLGVALATFAAVSDRLLLGAGVVLLPLRHPSLVAKQAASLDWISGGRLVLGLGVGGEGRGDFVAAGVPIEERGARADEGIVALRRLLTERPAAFVGGRSEAAQRRAGTLGDGWLPYLVSPRRYAAGVAAVRAHAAAAGRDPDELQHVLVAFACVDENGERARKAAQLHLSARYGMRFERHHVERLCVVGSPEECAARLEEYAAAGVTHLSFNPAVEETSFFDQVARLADVASGLRAAA